MKIFLICMTLVFSVFSSANEVGDNMSLLSFYQGIEGEWYEPMTGNSKDSFFIQYSLVDNVITLNGHSESTDDDGVTWAGSLFAEYRIDGGVLFSVGREEVQIKVIELTATKIVYQNPPYDIPGYSSTTSLELMDENTLVQTNSFSSGNESGGQSQTLKRAN